jgi:thiol-disulfide isomerase/thioredoxin
MKYKGLILIVLITIGAAAIFLLPDKKMYEEVASVGKSAPDFAYPDSNGKIWRLSDLRGKVVFINFWATWCTTCKAEMPHKEALFQKMQGKPFQMLGMPQKVSPPTLISPDNEAAKIFGITGVPETFIIDKDGVIRKKIVGPRVWDDPETMAMIEKWL